MSDQAPFRISANVSKKIFDDPAALLTISNIRSTSIDKRSQKDIASETAARWTPIIKVSMSPMVMPLALGSGDAFTSSWTKSNCRGRYKRNNAQSSSLPQPEDTLSM